MDDRRERFSAEYIKDLNATEAAIRSGYAKKTAYSQGSRLLKNVKVQEKIAALKVKIEQRITFTAADVLREMGRLAFVDMAGAYNKDGTLKNIHDMPEETRRALLSMESEESGDNVSMENDGEVKFSRSTTRKVKFHNKRDALRDLMQYFHLLDERTPDKDDSQINALLTFLKGGNK